MKLPAGIQSSAHYSECGKYRYALVRIWDSRMPCCLFIMLNPSTATELEDDPTVAKCRRYATAWGYGGIVILNAFAWRSTDPKALRGLDDPVGPENDRWTMSFVRHHVADPSRSIGGRLPEIICAWGKDGLLLSRASRVTGMLTGAGFSLHCLQLNQDGTPAHPLYLKESLWPIVYRDASQNRN